MRHLEAMGAKAELDIVWRSPLFKMSLEVLVGISAYLL